MIRQILRLTQLISDSEREQEKRIHHLFHLSLGWTDVREDEPALAFFVNKLVEEMRMLDDQRVQ